MNKTEINAAIETVTSLIEKVIGKDGYAILKNGDRWEVQQGNQITSNYQSRLDATLAAVGWSLFGQTQK